MKTLVLVNRFGGPQHWYIEKKKKKKMVSKSKQNHNTQNEFLLSNFK